jgi:hypothetical protein
MILSTLLCLPLLCSALDSQPRTPRRFLLAAASNDGGPDKIRLRYSGDDARNVVSVMRTLGRVREEDAVLLLEPDTAGFLSSLRDLSGRMAASRDSGRRVELVVYYSGHSDEDGLLLGSTHLPYSRLRRVLEGSPAEVRLAVLDACASGAALRSKGGVRRQAFRIEDAEGLRGQAFLTSSRAEEASQESDRIGGSFFTQAFLAGLRGAADADGDGRVTLLEAYRYAYEQTVERTSSTRSGAQHPEFDLDLSGSGDVVLTDLSQAGATLELGREMDGRLEVRDSSGAVVAQLVKAPGRPTSIGLPSGKMRIVVADSASQRVRHVDLLPGSRTVLAPSDADSILPVAARPLEPASRAADTALVDIPFNFGLLPPISTNGDRSSRARNRFSMDFLIGEAAEIQGAQMALGVAQTSRSVRGCQFAGGFARAQGNLSGFQAAFASLVDGEMKGAQMADICAVARKGGSGTQMASTVAWSGGNFVGAQFSSVSIAQGIRGAQFSVLNIGGSVSGTQFGVVNIARSVSGAQFGVVNIARSVSGADVGVVNIADTSHGAMVGVVNLARDLEAFPLGVLSLGLNMTPAVEAWIDETGQAVLALRLDSRRFHVKIAGIDAPSDPERLFGCGLGFGAQWRTDAWGLDLDYFYRQMWHRPAHGPVGLADMQEIALSASRSLGAVDIFAGVSANIVQTRDGSPDDFASPPGRRWMDPSGKIRLWPGLFAGLRI